MAENEGKEGGEELTQEQRDQQAAEKYRGQFSKSGDGGATDAQLGENKGTEGEGGDKPQRPDHIPEKFWDAEKGEVRVEDLAKSYAELEKSRNKPKDGEGEEGEGGEGEQGEEAQLAEVVKSISAHREKLTEKILAGTPLEDSDYEPLEKIGFSRDDTDAFIAGQKALGQLAEMRVHAEVGGEDAYKSMLEWAKANYSKEEVEVYNRDVYSNDETVRLTAARGLAARYAQANGKNGKSVTNKGGKAGADGYRSKAEMVTAMQDPRYKNDPAYRAEVQRKVEAAVASGVNLRL